MPWFRPRRQPHRKSASRCLIPDFNGALFSQLVPLSASLFVHRLSQGDRELVSNIGSSSRLHRDPIRRQQSLSDTLVLKARGMLGWSHVFGDVTPEQSLAFSGGQAFIIEGLPIAEDALDVEAGFDVGIGTNTTLGISYTASLPAAPATTRSRPISRSSSERCHDHGGGQQSAPSSTILVPLWIKNDATDHRYPDSRMRRLRFRAHGQDHSWRLHLDRANPGRGGLSHLQQAASQSQCQSISITLLADGSADCGETSPNVALT